MILSPLEPWYVGASASVAAIASKQWRVASANVLNPAAFGLVATSFLFSARQNWWGAMPDLPLPALALLAGAGLFIADRVNKIPLVQAFLGTYFLLFTIAAFAGDPADVAAMFRAPNLHMVLYFAFFMVTDPPTSPVKYRDQIVCGVLVAGSSFAVYELTRAVYFLPAGALVGNLWDAARRARRRRGQGDVQTSFVSASI
jgi:Na+-translocating ferredoxin:NAD+ oxidoreductase RnfD subunit